MCIRDREDTVDESILLEKMGKALKKGKPLSLIHI